MYSAKTKKEQFWIFSKLLFPVLVYQMISYSSGMIGTFMAGHYSPTDLAGLSMGVNIWNPIISVVNTLVIAIIPIVSQLVGENKHKEVPTKVRQFLYIGLIISSLIAIFLFFFSEEIVNRVGLRDDIKIITTDFLKYQSLGLIPIVIYVLLRSFIDSLGLTRVSMTIMLIYVPINILLSYIFIFGKFGAPELGGVGVAVATNITYIISLLIALFVIKSHPKINRYKIFKFEKIKLNHWKEILKLAIPMAIAVFIESFMFSALSLMVARFDTFTIAGHQSSLNFAGFLYSLPMSVSSAITIIVAYYVGSKSYKKANEYVNIGVMVSIFFSAIISMIIIIFANYIPYLYGEDEQFVKITSKLLYFVVGFAIFDTFASCIVGVLRAYKRVVPTCVCMFIGYYIVGLPLAYYLVNKTELGVYGLWIAWLVGLGSYAVLVLVYYQKTIRKNYI